MCPREHCTLHAALCFAQQLACWMAHAALHALHVGRVATSACSTQSEKAALQSKLAAADKRSEAQVHLASLITLEYEEYP